jgi:hypothetical protein
MKTNLSISQLFIHSEVHKKSFLTSFGPKLNVIYGANTSGKSTLIQLILYAFGINDNRQKLNDILSEEVFVRIDFAVKSDVEVKYTAIRNNETLFLKNHENNKVVTFSGISGNTSYEHAKLKDFIRSMLNFDLVLETKNGLSDGPIETIFLPYYVSQDVGWVYLRKSFSNLDFYKNFKEDFLDYYFGIANNEDRSERKKIEAELTEKLQRYNFYYHFEKNDSSLDNAKIVDSSLRGKGEEFIAEITTIKNNLLKVEDNYVKKSNQLTHNNQRLSVISKVSRNHGNQFPGKDPCPICNQILPQAVDTLYKHFQEANDTVKIKSEILTENKKLQAEINSLITRTAELRELVAKEYSRFNTYSKDNITLDEWISVQANIKLEASLVDTIGKLTIEITELKEKLKEFKKDDEIQADRNEKNRDFKKYYNTNNTALDVPRLDDDRFNYVYELSTFPFQGVQLHLAVLSYHFAFNRLIAETNSIHRLPFILDSVFKEDLEAKSKEEILGFICSNLPRDTQTIISIADNKAKEPKINYYKEKFFKDDTTLIEIGESINKKSILVAHQAAHDNVLQDSFEIMEQL